MLPNPDVRPFPSVDYTAKVSESTTLNIGPLKAPFLSPGRESTRAVPTKGPALVSIKRANVHCASLGRPSSLAGNMNYGRIRFVVRCALVASLAYVVAEHIGLPQPVWAPISALVVTQESVTATLSSMLGRFFGTLLGVSVALLVHRVGTGANISLVSQIALSVAICAACTGGYAKVSVCLWTCPLVLVTATSIGGAEMTALVRGSEVVLGAAIGGFVHIFEERALLPLARRVLQQKDHSQMRASRFDSYHTTTRAPSDHQSRYGE
jgi:uncharacterized membrane protein YccC